MRGEKKEKEKENSIYMGQVAQWVGSSGTQIL